VPVEMSTLSYTTEITLTPDDGPYSYVRADRELSKKPGQVFLSTGNPIIQSPTTPVIVKDAAPMEASKEDVVNEMEFLSMLGLAYKKGDKWYIMKRADDLYNSVDGVFHLYATGNSPAAIAKTKSLMLEYVLPGRYWRNYFAAMSLPNDISYSRNLHQEMQEITREYNEVMMKNPPA
jgi:hypothetical protein